MNSSHGKVFFIQTYFGLGLFANYVQRSATFDHIRMHRAGEGLVQRVRLAIAVRVVKVVVLVLAVGRGRMRGDRVILVVLNKRVIMSKRVKKTH